MRLKAATGGAEIALDQGPEINFCRPAVDPMFETAAQIYRAGVLACILTGMGQDGTNGGKVIAAAGGSVITQDEETSVVWGMREQQLRLAFAAPFCRCRLSVPKSIHCSSEKLMTSEQFNFIRSFLKRNLVWYLAKTNAICLIAGSIP